MHAVLSDTLTLAFPETMTVMSEPLLFFEDAFKLFEIIGMRASCLKPTVKPLTPSDKPLISFLGLRSDSAKSAPVTVMAFLRGYGWLTRLKNKIHSDELN